LDDEDTFGEDMQELDREGNAIVVSEDVDPEAHELPIAV
jgi:hypothetical protein